MASGDNVQLLYLKNDYVFRKIFGDERNIDALASFIRSTGCLRDDQLKDLRILDPQLLSDDPEGKNSTLDVFAVTGGGENIHIEIQLLNTDYFPERVIFYMSKILSGKLRIGEDYGAIGRVITIIIVNWNMSDDDVRFHKVYSMREAKTGEQFSDVLELHTLELKRVPKNADDDELCCWLRMIKSERRDEMEMLAARSPELGKVYSRLVELSADDAERMRAEMREKWRRDWSTAVRCSEARGIKIGEAKGIKIGEAKGIKIGEAKGIKIGEAKGIKIGEARGIISMARKFSMSDSDIISQLAESLSCGMTEAESILRGYDEQE